jgi:hypothetical protein
LPANQFLLLVEKYNTSYIQLYEATKYGSWSLGIIVNIQAYFISIPPLLVPFYSKFEDVSPNFTASNISWRELLFFEGK